MPDPITALVGGVASIGQGLLGADAASSAAGAEVSAANSAIAEQRAAREELRTLLSPYTKPGIPALDQMMAIAGLGGQEQQSAAISGIENSPLFQTLARQGEDAILQNASATGGVRGSNAQGVLAQFRPDLLQRLIEQQFGRLGGLAQIGQNSAAGVGSAGMSTAANIGQLFGNIGSANAGAALGSANAWGGALNNFTQGVSAYPGGIGGLLKAAF